MNSLKHILKALVEKHGSLDRNQAREVLQQILTSAPGEDDVEIASLMTALATRGETVDELVGFVEALRAAAVPLPLTEDERDAVIDTCGTGGDGAGTFNISTAAALVAVGAGAKVAKHGNRAVTSKCGSADVLEALGVPVMLAPDRAVDCLRQTGFMFMLAPALHPAMKRVLPLRRTLGFRTIFNLAGPLTNPAGAPAQIMGVYEPSRVPLVAEAMARLGMRHAFVVHGGDGLDELTLSGESSVAEVRDGRVKLFRLVPEDAGLLRVPLAAMAGADTVEENAVILEKVISGEIGPRRDIVLLNASAALVAAGIASDLFDGVQRGARAIDSGAVKAVLKSLREFGASEAKS
ncbi:anthranilate phosphoribosyltransferase [Silvibacterium acidisoli]|uniref:anthranilate phosphoribosyltransferase n=1 Tax=Acidobacteriaceae bacterium ZG23-2 TaxID=2883246 RepID=UPI00406CD27F